MRVRTFVFITVLSLCHPHVWAQALTMQFPPSGQSTASASPEPQQTAAPQQTDANLPDAPSAIAFPVASTEPTSQSGTPVKIEANEQQNQGNRWTLSGEVVIHYRDYVLRADRVIYYSETHDAEADGHVQLEGGPDHELISATRAVLNLELETGRFYTVLGSIGVHRTGKTVLYTNKNPFIFTGKVVIKSGPDRYQIIGGTMTSCELPRPDWTLASRHITVEDGQARSTLTSFHLLGVPLLYLPYVTHPTDATRRQSGFLIPTFGTSSSKGTIFGEQIYLALNRSTDLTVGSEYYSERGFAPTGEFRHRGAAGAFAEIRWNALLDRGQPKTHINQGGVDLLVNARRDYGKHIRSVANVEYLSSYVYRLAFTDNVQQAIHSEVKSNLFATYNQHGISSSVFLDRYQNYQGTQTGEEVKILHTPSLLFESVDQPLGASRIEWGLQIESADLARSEQNFQIKDVGRLDIYPHISLPIVRAGWTFRPEIALRNTFYGKSQRPGVGLPTARSASLNRSDIEADFELRPPAVERDYFPGWLGRELRHVLEGEVRYRYVNGVGSDFRSVLQFDATDLVSDTHEVFYSLTQKLYLRNPATRPCKKEETPNRPNGLCADKGHEWLSWQLGQKYFFDTEFGGALAAGRRNVLESTLDLTGPSFLVYPRSTSPLISRMRVSASENIGLEWDADYDTVTGRLNASNIFADYRRGNMFFGFGQAQMDAPEEQGNQAQESRFHQLRPFLAYGNPSRAGLNLAANAGYDLEKDTLQYGGVQTAWNWDCCGIGIEYRRYALGSVRNENQFRFNFALAGIGSFGNLRRAERIF